MDFGATLSSEPPNGANLRLGIVTQASPLLVQVGGADTAVPASSLGSYAPILNDYVAVLEQGADRIVMGRSGTGLRPRTTYTPTLKAGGVAITLGNGTISGYVSSDGTRAFVEIEHVLGSTTSYGLGGALTFTLPTQFAPVATVLGFAVGRVVIGDGFTPYFRDVLLTAGSELAMWADGTQVTNTVPFTMGAGDYFRLSASYPIA